MSTSHLILRAEGILVLLASLVLYRHLGGHWPLFALLFFAPDLSMLGYLANPRLGSVLYNLAHTYVLPLTLALAAILRDHRFVLPYLAIWSAHIGFDRLLGYGLKYPTAFKDTHLQRV